MAEVYYWILPISAIPRRLGVISDEQVSPSIENAYFCCISFKLLLPIAFPFLQASVKILLENQADCNARDKNWQTPFHIAAANNFKPCLGKELKFSCLKYLSKGTQKQVKIFTASICQMNLSFKIFMYCRILCLFPPTICVMRRDSSSFENLDSSGYRLPIVCLSCSLTSLAVGLYVRLGSRRSFYVTFVRKIRCVIPFLHFFCCLPQTLPDFADALLPYINNINVTDRAGRSSLHHAAYNGHMEVIMIIISIIMIIYEFVYRNNLSACQACCYH